MWESGDGGEADCGDGDEPAGRWRQLRQLDGPLFASPSLLLSVVVYVGVASACDICCSYRESPPASSDRRVNDRQRISCDGAALCGVGPDNTASVEHVTVPTNPSHRDTDQMLDFGPDAMGRRMTVVKDDAEAKNEGESVEMGPRTDPPSPVTEPGALHLRATCQSCISTPLFDLSHALDINSKVAFRQRNSSRMNDC